MNIEAYIRRTLSKHGYVLNKTPPRHWTRKYYGVGYMVSRDNTVVIGCFFRAFDATLEDVIAFMRELNIGEKVTAL